MTFIDKIINVISFLLLLFLVYKIIQPNIKKPVRIIDQMGICYSEQQQWEAYHKEIREKRRNRKRRKNASIIYEENSVYENSFASKVEDSFREDIFESVSNLVNESGSILSGGSYITVGSIVEMSQEELKVLHDSLNKINANSQLHNLNEQVTLCNFKTKNFIHTHKVSHPDLPKQNEVSCCPSNSNHIIEYDIWKFIKVEHQDQQAKQDAETSQSHHENQQSYYIFHPFTKKFLNYNKGYVVCAEEKKPWRIVSFGPRRNGGFVKITCDEGELCMTDERGLLSNHKKLELCASDHVGHLWELKFGQVM